MSRIVYQVRLWANGTERTCWVDKKVTPGSEITLKNSDEPERWWVVQWVSVPLSKESVVGKTWKVGGL